MREIISYKRVLTAFFCIFCLKIPVVESDDLEGRYTKRLFSVQRAKAGTIRFPKTVFFLIRSTKSPIILVGEWYLLSCDYLILSVFKCIFFCQCKSYMSINATQALESPLLLFSLTTSLVHSRSMNLIFIGLSGIR